MAGNLNQLMAIEIETGVSANYDYVTTRGFEIVDLIGCTNITDVLGPTNTAQTNIGGLGFVALSAALATDTIDDIEYAGTLVGAQATMGAGDTLRMVVANSVTALQANIYAWVIPTSWIAG